MRILKISSLILIFATNNLAHAVDDWNLPDWEIGPDHFYQIVSDEFDEAIQEGSCIIEGSVRMWSSKAPIQNAEVNAYNSSGQEQIERENLFTDSSGLFRMKIPSGTEQFCAYFLDFAETCISNYKFKSQHRIQVLIYLYQASNTVKRKPVIYLYSDDPMDASIKVKPYGEFTFTYPDYKNGWEVEIDNENQIRLQGSDRTYPYLFWEAQSNDILLKSSGTNLPGFFIKSDTALLFLESSLELMGLNETEKTDFITYWAPIIERDEYALLQFLIDDDCEKTVASLDIQPNPESIRRIYLIHAPYKNNEIGYDVQAQEFKNFERKGFTVVEWGGGQIDLQRLKP
jgi:hypothetical protein